MIIFVHRFVPWWPSRCKPVEFWIKGFWINSSVFVPAPQKYLKVVFCSRVPTRFINSTAVYIEFVDIKNPRTNHHIFKKFESAINIILYYNCISTVRHSQRVILHQQYYDVFMSLTGATLQMVGRFPEDSQDCSEVTGRIQPSHWDPQDVWSRLMNRQRGVMVEQSERRQEINSIWRKRRERLGEQGSVTFKPSVTYRQTWQTHPLLQEKLGNLCRNRLW